MQENTQETIVRKESNDENPLVFLLPIILGLALFVLIGGTYLTFKIFKYPDNNPDEEESLCDNQSLDGHQLVSIEENIFQDGDDKFSIKSDNIINNSLDQDPHIQINID
ncbi:hypothetical protein DICPUDRAFT_83748 [Dictyostelium purpureum]|uniref:Uncharacterized protein n=1 Tax=Dictyostelium purpureum TaxID=5786 RepID=F1A0H8_DICPU|nr:uncharacterized protein DICPUDRAFT_83748 [Dictyostelium purpureum]EGC30297.1 hypothetical protein DICPUDRAFT_83748 [Dictyostelium purpureum]|eukprot:XP_003293176.1 hypothetical protein DICPUDRAFT_83748 [Dictyostelium purpureum]